MEKTSVDFNTINYSKENINTYGGGDESEQESDFSTDTSENDSFGSDCSP